MRTAKRRRPGPKSAGFCPLVFSFAVLFAGLATPAWAADGNEADLSQINRRLSALAVQSQPAARGELHGPADAASARPTSLPQISVRRAAPQAPGSFVPAKILKIAQQMQGADRLMHFRGPRLRCQPLGRAESRPGSQRPVLSEVLTEDYHPAEEGAGCAPALLLRPLWELLQSRQVVHRNECGDRFSVARQH